MNYVGQSGGCAARIDFVLLSCNPVLRKGGLLLMLNRKELQRLIPLAIFFAVYTILFFLWVKTFFYTLPFLLGLILAVLIHPIIRFLDKKLKWNHTLSTALVTLTAVGLTFALLVFLGVFAVREIVSFLQNVSTGGFTRFSEPVTEFIQQLNGFLGNINLDFFSQNRKDLIELVQNSLDLIVACLGTLLGVVTSLPTVITMLLVTVFSTFFIARDLEKLQSWAKSLLTGGVLFHLKTAAKNSESTGRKYLLSYLLIYFITFCEAYIILSVLNVSYPLTLSLVAAVADVLPVLGPGFVLLPLAVYQLLIGEYASAIGLPIGWLIITCIRQIVEPKLISGTAKIHPLAMLAAIYFSLVGKSIWILFYVMGYFTLYAAFRETGALPAFSNPITKKTTQKPD